MNDEIIAKINEMNLDDLSEAARVVLSRLYRKLREEEGFGYDQHCSVISFGSDEYDVQLMVIDGTSHNTGSNWPRAWWA